MYEGLLEVLLNGGPMALFAAYLVWAKNKQDQKLEGITLQFFNRLDEITDKHENVREVLEDKYENRMEQTRERWLTVVQKTEQERDETQKTLQQTTGTLTSSLDNLKSTVEKQNVEISKLCDRVFQLSTTKKELDK